MASDKDIKINIKTSADTKGAKDASAAVDDVAKSQVRIIDSTKKSTEEIEKNKKAFEEWQAGLNAKRKEGGGSSGLAVDPEEINKAKQAAEQLSDTLVKETQAAEGSIEQLENELKKLESQLRKIPVGSQAFLDMAKKVDVAKQALTSARATALTQYANEQNNVARGGRQMGSVLQNVGYQAADVAVQLEMGTSAARVFTQQGSQMLGVLGPWGAIAGAALAIGGAIFAASTKTKDASETTDELTDAYKKLMDAAADAEKAYDLNLIEDVNESYQNRIESIDQMLGKLKDELSLQTQLRDIELERQDAEAAFAIRQVEASELNEVDKLKQVAIIRKDMADRRAANEKAQIEATKVSASLEVQAVEEKRRAAEKAYAEQSAKEKEAKKAVEDINAEIKRREEVEARIYDKERNLSQAKKQFDNAKAPLQGEFASPTAKDLQELNEAEKKYREIKADVDKEKSSLKDINYNLLQEARKGLSNKEADKIKDPGKVLDDKRSKADEIYKKVAGEGGEGGELEKAEKQLQEQTIALAEARAKQAAILKLAEAKEASINTRKSIAIATEGMRVQEGESKIREQRIKDSEVERERLDRGAESRRGQEASIGRGAASLLPKETSEKFRRAVESAAKGLQDGDQGGEIEKLTLLMEQLAVAVQKKDAKTGIKIANLQEQIKKLRD